MKENKNQMVHFRLTGVDFEYLRKEAERQGTTISEILRKFVNRLHQKQERTKTYPKKLAVFLNKKLVKEKP